MIFVLIFIAYALGLWRMSVPMTGDQKVYLSVALEMKERASFIIPYLFDQPNFLKPPFQYWMTLLGWQIFGISIFGAMLPSVIALVASAYLVKKLSPDKSNLSALVFSSTLATMTYGTTAQMEIWVVLFYLGAWLLFLKKKPIWSFLLVGVLAWIKGPLYSALFVVSILIKAALEGNLRELKKVRFLGALCFGIAVGLLWYAAAAATQFDLLKNFFFGRENFGKLQTSQGSPLGLWTEFLGTLFPIIFLVLASIGDPGFRARLKMNRIFWLAFSGFPALFFTLFPYRVNTYLYLLTPVVSWLVISKPNPRPALRVAIQIASATLAIVGIVFAYRLSIGSWISVWLGLGISLTFIGWAFSNFKLNGAWIAASSLILVNLVRIGATEIGEWDLQPLRQASHGQDFSYLIDASHEDIWHEFGLISAALGRPVLRVRDTDQERSFLEKGGSVILSDEQNPLPGSQCDPWRRLKRRIKFPIKDLLKNGLSIENPELHRTFQICRFIK